MKINRALYTRPAGCCNVPVQFFSCVRAEALGLLRRFEPLVGPNQSLSEDCQQSVPHCWRIDFHNVMMAVNLCANESLILFRLCGESGKKRILVLQAAHVSPTHLSLERIPLDCFCETPCGHRSHSGRGPLSSLPVHEKRGRRCGA